VFLRHLMGPDFLERVSSGFSRAVDDVRVLQHALEVSSGEQPSAR